MRRTVAALPLLLALAGCVATTSTPAAETGAGPTTPSVSLAEALEATPAVAPPMPGSDERFLRLLSERGVPYVGRNPRVEASIVCANLTLRDSREFAEAQAPPSDPEHQRLFVDTAIEVYCPKLG